MMRLVYTVGIATCYLAFVATASAHVMLESKTARVGSTLRAIFDVGHGCGHSPTTKVRIKIPAGVLDIVAEPKPGWEITTLTAVYDQPYSNHGVPVKEGVTEVAWSGLLSAHEIGKFVLTFGISDSLESNQRVYFPVVQECQKDIVRWIDKSDESDHPAPSLLLLAGH
jgi:periplasmic copper chaperone A